MQNTTIKIDSHKLAKQIASIDKISHKNKWSFNYDPDLDTLYYSPEKIKNSFSLYSLTDDFAVYVDSKSNLGGVFVEYYKTNLTSHDDKFRRFANIFTENLDHSKTVPASKAKDALVLSELLKAELLSGIVINDQAQISLPA